MKNLIQIFVGVCLFMLVNQMATAQVNNLIKGKPNAFEKFYGTTQNPQTRGATDALVYIDWEIQDGKVLAALTSLGYNYVVATSWTDFNSKLSYPTYKLAVMFNQNDGIGANLTTVTNFISAGGSMVYSDWTRTASFATLFQATFTGVNNQTVMTLSPSIATGLPNPLTLVNTGWGIFSTGLTATGGAEVLATFPNGNASIVRGNSGRTIILGYLSDVPPADYRQRLFENLFVSVVTPSGPTDPTSVTASSNPICNGTSTLLTANGVDGTVYWYTGSCGGTATSPATGNTLTVSPVVNTTYYARNYNNGQFSTNCASITITVAAQPTAPSLTKNPNVASVCVGQSLTVSATSGAGGAGTVTDQYSYSTNNGSSWSAWSTSIPGFNAVVGTNLIRSRRTATASGCNESSYNQVSWNVVAQPTAPGLTKVPTAATVCVNQMLTVTTTAGSGGTGTIADEYRFSTNNGTNWSAWSTSVPSFAAVSGTNLIQSRRTATGTGCNESSYNQVSWGVYQAFTSGAIATTGETICSGTSSVTTIGSTTPASGGDGTITYKWQANGNDIANSDAATYLPGVLTQTTTFTRWAKDGTCNTEFTQSSGNWVVTVNPLLQFRSTQSGNWTTLANWQQYNGSGWVTATSFPGQINNSCSNPLVTIQAAHSIEIQSGSIINIPNLEIKATGKLTVKPGGKIFVQDQLQLDESAGEAIIVESN